MSLPSIRRFAERLLATESLEDKLAPPPPRLPDTEPGVPVRWRVPGRPPGLEIARGRGTRVPPAQGMADPAQRARILHALANHELQAAEAFAWVLLAFPDAPGGFRRGCLAILAEEQEHCRLYIERLTALGAGFGDHPVTGHFWRKLRDMASPLEFVCTMGLTFESANLDFAREFADAARGAGDEETAAVLERVHLDEIRHVRFAVRWLRRWKPSGVSDFDAYRSTIRPPHGPSRARGATFDRAAREAAGLDEEFVSGLESARPERPGGAPR